ncbi:MAG: PhzF family phenazine biosynthesis protein [Verrucomicrobiota bacterium]|nr:PhzF family phenazine biosynthesis protein [Verrucomicrobiota bacterium]
MKLPVSIINAFTQRVFGGNPAAVCPLETWLPDATLQAIAEQHNLAETAFTVPLDAPGSYHLRWFTPAVEVPLCGHATLAAAHVLFAAHPTLETLRFHTLSGWLTVIRAADRLTLDFPARTLVQPAPKPVVDALFPSALEAWVDSATNLFVILPTEAAVKALTPDLPLLARHPYHGAIITAPGDTVDFVSRFFAPALGVPEDPVTGSAHCTLTPYWATRLGKPTLTARQVSRRGGELWVHSAGERVHISGHARTYATGIIDLPELA